MNSFYEAQQRFFVVIPLTRQLTGRGIFATAEFEGDFEAVGVDVVEVLHAAADFVPKGAVRDAVGEVVVLASVAFGHYRVRFGVGEG